MCRAGLLAKGTEGRRRGCSPGGVRPASASSPTCTATAGNELGGAAGNEARAARCEAGAPAGEPGAHAGGTTGRREGRLQARRSVLPAYRTRPSRNWPAVASARPVCPPRWATSGLAVAERTLTISNGRVGIRPPGKHPVTGQAGVLVEPGLAGGARGTTDSEAYFLYLLQCFEQEGNLIGGSVARSLTYAAPAVPPVSRPYCSRGIACRGARSTGLAPPREDLLRQSRGPRICRRPSRGYFGLRYRQSTGRSSSPPRSRP